MKFSFPSTRLELGLLNSIDSIAMFPVSETEYRLLNHKPEWLNLLGTVIGKQKLVLNKPENFLENFLLDAKKFWSANKKGTLRSGKWVQTNVKGIDHPFEAIASIIQGQPVLMIQLITDSYLEVGRILQSARENALTREKTEHLAYHDELTGLYNRRGFLLHAEEHLRIARCKQKPVTIACIDLDRLKIINDKYGHKAGDQTIINAATLFKKIFRQNDILGRIGGDEFHAMIINMDTVETISFKARLNRIIDNFNSLHEPHQKIAFSIGLASDNAEKLPLEQLVSEADIKMYIDKKSKYDIEMRS